MKIVLLSTGECRYSIWMVRSAKLEEDSSEGNGTEKQTQMQLESVHKSKSITNLTQKAIHYASHQWTIDKFSAFCFNSPKNHSIDSQIFTTLTDTRLSFFLILRPNCDDDHSKEKLSANLRFISHDISQVTAKYQITLLDVNGDKSYFKIVGQSTIPQNNQVTISKEIPRSFFKFQRTIREYLQKDKLTILCEIWAIKDRKVYKNKQIQMSGTTSSQAHINMNNVNGSYVTINSMSEIGGNVDLKNISANPKQ